MQFFDSQGHVPDVSAGSSLSVFISPVTSLPLTAAAHVLKDKTTGSATNQWLSRGEPTERLTARCQLSVSGSSLTLNLPLLIICWFIRFSTRCSVKQKINQMSLSNAWFPLTCL